MKKLILLVLLVLSAFFAEAQLISPSQLKPVDGFVRKSPCQAGSTDACGSEPATWPITPDQCGFIFSTSSARDEQYTRTLTGNGTTTAFAFNFGFIAAADLKVTVAGVTKTLTTDYTVTSPSTAGGTVTFTVAPANATSVVIAVKNTWNGDGVTVAFPFHFPVKYINTLVVKVGGVTKAYSTDYTITAGLGTTTGGTVTFTAAPAVGTDNVSIAMASSGTTRGNAFY
jgi:hypothetical protein